MPKTPCHDAFNAAKIQRTKYPLRSGAYKLREARTALRRMQSTMTGIRIRLKNPDDKYPCPLLGCCTLDDMDDWLKNLPTQLATKLGYDIMPAIEALTGDGIAKIDVDGELYNAKIDTRRLLNDCETQHTQLQANVVAEHQAIKSGYSDVYALLVDADGIARRALELITWCEVRARLAESSDLVGMWDWPAV